MPSYVPPLRDLQFVLHELLDLENELKAMPKHAETDADTINAVLEEGGKFAAEVVFPLNVSGDEEGCKLDRDTHEVSLQVSNKLMKNMWRVDGRPSARKKNMAVKVCPSW
ncbi:MAG: Acyl-CoA dehydrogenase [Pseudomonadota bacterium]